MTDQQRATGYRGALPTRNDALARPWVLIVIALFALMFVLSFLGFPSSILSTASPSISPSLSLAPSASASAEASASSSDLVSPPPTE
jgi:hypothetical protein